MKKMLAYLGLGLIAVAMTLIVVMFVAAFRNEKRLMVATTLALFPLLETMICWMFVQVMRTGKTGGFRLPVVTRERQPIQFWFQATLVLAVLAIFPWGWYMMLREWRQMS